MLGLSESELAVLFQVSASDVHAWVRTGVPADVMRVIWDYEQIAEILGQIARKRGGASVPLIARERLDALHGRSVLTALAAGERERVRQAVTATRSDDRR